MHSARWLKAEVNSRLKDVRVWFRRKEQWTVDCWSTNTWCMFMPPLPQQCTAHPAIALMASCSASPVVAPSEEDPSTHTGRNLSQPQQKTWLLTRHPLSLAQKATHSLRQIADHAKAEELATALDTLLSRHHTELEDLAKEHNTKLEYVQKLTSQSSHYKQRRAIGIQNAKLHAKSLEVNGGMHTICHGFEIWY